MTSAAVRNSAKCIAILLVFLVVGPPVGDLVFSASGAAQMLLFDLRENLSDGGTVRGQSINLSERLLFAYIFGGMGAFLSGGAAVVTFALDGRASLKSVLRAALIWGILSSAIFGYVLAHVDLPSSLMFASSALAAHLAAAILCWLLVSRLRKEAP